MLGGIVGDENVQRAMSNYAKTWAFKHPSPWDYIFFMNAELKQDLNWFWYYWLWTTEAVNGKIENVTTTGTRTTVTVRQDGEMPSPVVLRVKFAETGAPLKPMANAKIEGNSALVTWPVDVWFNGSRTFRRCSTGGRTIPVDPARPGVPLPGSRCERQRVAEAGCECGSCGAAGRSTAPGACAG
jgi:hypothetical protein